MKSRPNVRWFVCVAFPLVMVCGGICCRNRTFDEIYVLHAKDLSAVNSRARTKDVLTRATRGMALPRSANDISICRGESIDFIAYVVFSADHDDIIQFVEQSLKLQVKQLERIHMADGHVHMRPDDVCPHRDFVPWRELSHVDELSFYSGTTYRIGIDWKNNRVYFIGL